MQRAIKRSDRPELALGSGRGDRGQHAAASSEPTAFAALSYRSIGEGAASADLIPTDAWSLDHPARSDLALNCLAFGIGRGGDATVAALAAAPWFSHLRGTAQGPVRGIAQQAKTMLRDVLGRMRGLHVVSVALPDRPSQAELDAACVVGWMARQQDAFTIATVPQPSRTAVAGLGGAFDCLVEGDGESHHHEYPARTVTEPAGGRPICYDLYDVCSMWAGRVGRFGTMIPAADALHVEVSADVTSLAEVDLFGAGMAVGLDCPARLCLINVVAGARAGATAVSFLDDPVIRQERVPVTRAIQGGRS